MDIIIRYKLNLEIDNFKNSYQNLNEGREYEELLQREEQRIRKLSGIELTLKIQCEKYADRKTACAQDRYTSSHLHL